MVIQDDVLIFTRLEQKATRDFPNFVKAQLFIKPDSPLIALHYLVENQQPVRQLFGLLQRVPHQLFADMQSTYITADVYKRQLL